MTARHRRGKFNEQYTGFRSYPMNVEENGCFRLPQINAAQEDGMEPALKMSVADSAQTREEIARLTEDELRALSKDAFFWGMHPAAMYEMRYFLTQMKRSPSYVGDGRMHWDRRPRSAADKSATAPNATTLYGMGFFDLRREPVVVATPAVPDRYFSVQAVSYTHLTLPTNSRV